MLSIKLVFIELSIFIACLACAESREWTPASYPNPSTEDGYKMCQRPSKSFVCDPDSVISQGSANVVEGIIKDIHNAADPYANDGCTSHSTNFPGFQVTVALMEKMQLLDTAPQQAAENFAIQLFNTWGVGDAKCQNGVLLLLSKHDRQVYIYAGKGALERSSEAKLKLVIDRMRPVLRQGDYNAALEQGIVDLGLVLAGGEPKAEPEDSYWGLGIFLSIFAGIIGLVSWKNWQERKDQRKVVSLLEKLKKEQRHAVSTGRYPAASCPICFEDFENPASTLPRTSDRNQASKADESTSHDASAPLINPLLRQSLKGKTKKDGLHENSKEEKKAEGKGRLTLPCGHAFCEPCISSWLKDHVTCPVCRKPMGSEDDDQGPGPSDRRPPPPPRDECDSTYNRDRQMELYNEEVQFRMMGLHRLYPWYVTTNMVNHASDMAHQEQFFDFEAVRQEQLAQRAQHMHQGQAGSGNISFGGGSSVGGGGAGGSW